MTSWKTVALAGALSMSLIAGCGSGSNSSSPGPSPSTTAAAESGHLVVFAAASLKSSFTAIGEQFKTDNPGTSVEFSFAGSSDLVTQLTQGAPADVFASADTRNMDKAAQAGLLDGAPVNFASNTLTIVVAPGNPKDVSVISGPDEAGPERGHLRPARAVRRRHQEGRGRPPV